MIASAAAPHSTISIWMTVGVLTGRILGRRARWRSVGVLWGAGSGDPPGSPAALGAGADSSAPAPSARRGWSLTSVDTPGPPEHRGDQADRAPALHPHR